MEYLNAVMLIVAAGALVFMAIKINSIAGALKNKSRDMVQPSPPPPPPNT